MNREKKQRAEKKSSNVNFAKTEQHFKSTKTNFSKHKCHVCGEEGHRFVWRRHKNGKTEWVRNERCKKKLSPDREKKELQYAKNQMIEEYLKRKQSRETQGTVNEVKVVDIIESLKKVQEISPEDKSKIYAELSSYNLRVIGTVHLNLKTEVHLHMQIMKEDVKLAVTKGELDSGSDLTLVGKRIYKKLHEQMIKQGKYLETTSLPFPVNISTATGDTAIIYYSVNVDIEIQQTNTKLKNVTVYVVDNDQWDILLIGEDVLQPLGLMPHQLIAKNHVYDMSKELKTQIEGYKKNKSVHHSHPLVTPLSHYTNIANQE
jgi:hypothetical protein